MNATALIEFLSSIAALSPALRAAVDELVLSEHYRPHQVVHAAGQTESRCWFLVSGLARTYYLDRAGKEHTLAFFLEDQLVWSVQGYWNEPSDYYLEVLEPAVMLSISYRSLHRLIETSPEAAKLVQALIRQQYHRELIKNRLLTLTAEERYREVRKTMPELFRRVSVRLIASYLNMTRENLSRLMGRDL